MIIKLKKKKITSKTTVKRTNGQQTNNKQITTNKNDKNVKNGEEINNNIAEIDRLFIETLGSTNLNNIKECTEYLDKLPLEVIEYALKITARNNAKWNYARTILDSYVEKNIDTLEKVKADELQFKSRNNKQTEEKQETEEEKTARKIKALEEGLKNANW